MKRWMGTFTGRKFFPLEPDIADIDIEDVARGLANTCRYGGQTMRYYSVAEHCVLVSRNVAPEFAREALLHDTSEAYLGDMISPIKYQPEMEQFRLAERKLEEAVVERFGLRPFTDTTVWDVVKEIDDRILVDEIHALMRVPELYIDDRLAALKPLGIKIYSYPPAMAEAAFLHRFNHLFPEHKRDFEALK